MSETLALLDLAGNVALLLWGLHMVQTGIMRSYSGVIRRYISQALHNRLKAVFAGMVITAMLQSSTAVGLMAASFTASGLIDLIPAMALMLGANIGTTLIVQILAFDISRVAPVLMLAGVIIFRNSERSGRKDIGRIIIGLGLMLLSLQQMLTLLHAAEDTQGLQVLLSLIAQDYMLDMLFAAVLTWTVHSSVAVVLLIMSFAAQKMISVKVAFALVLGANLGSAINPVVEGAKTINPADRRLAIGNLINRTVGCFLLLFLLPLADYLPPELTQNMAHAVANFHSFFNVLMAVIFFPLLPWFAGFLKRLLQEKAIADPTTPQYLDVKLQDNPSLALSNATRETLRMTDVLKTMLKGVAELFANADRKSASTIRETDNVLDQLNRQIKFYLTSLKLDKMTPQEQARSQEIILFAMDIEHAGDTVCEGLVKNASKLIKRSLSFSQEGWAEIHTILEQVIDDIALSDAVFMTGDMEAAKQLRARKESIRESESRATAAHFVRLREGRQESIETSAIHLDTLRYLRSIHSNLSAVAGRLLKI